MLWGYEDHCHTVGVPDPFQSYGSWRKGYKSALIRPRIWRGRLPPGPVVWVRWKINLVTMFSAVANMSMSGVPKTENRLHKISTVGRGLLGRNNASVVTLWVLGRCVGVRIIINWSRSCSWGDHCPESLCSCQLAPQSVREASVKKNRLGSGAWSGTPWSTSGLLNHHRWDRYSASNWIGSPRVESAGPTCLYPKLEDPELRASMMDKECVVRDPAVDGGNFVGRHDSRCRQTR